MGKVTPIRGRKTDEANKAAGNGKAVQAPLLLKAPPTFEERWVQADEVLREPWGAAPTDELIRNVSAAGVLMPILFVKVKGGKLRIVEGRRRFQAAEICGQIEFLGRILPTGLGSGVHAVHLGGNAVTSQNPIMDLNAVEEIMVAEGIDDAVEIARRAALPLSVIRKVLKLQGLDGRLKDGAREGKIGAKAITAAASCDVVQQRELVKRLEANSTVTAADVAEVKKSKVSSHQRTLPSENTAKRVRESLEKARRDSFSEWGDEELVALLDKALARLAEIV